MMRNLKMSYKHMQRELFKKRLQWKNKNTDFTLISQNCIGGVIYSDLGLKFLTPTINMFIEDENFLKLILDFHHYMNAEPEPLCDNYIDPINKNIHYPKIKILDIEVCCLHYQDCNEAIMAWNRRRKRVNFNNVFVIGNTWNMHNNAVLVKTLIERSPYKTIMFSTKECACEGTFELPGDFWKLDERGIVRPDLTAYMDHGYKMYFEKLWDFVTWLND